MFLYLFSQSSNSALRPPAWSTPRMRNPDRSSRGGKKSEFLTLRFVIIERSPRRASRTRGLLRSGLVPDRHRTIEVDFRIYSLGHDFRRFVGKQIRFYLSYKKMIYLFIKKQMDLLIRSIEFIGRLICSECFPLAAIPMKFERYFIKFYFQHPRAELCSPEK